MPERILIRKTKVPFTKVAKVSELDSGKCLVKDVGGSTIAIFNVDGKFYAIDEYCPHQGGPLHEGIRANLSITCPWHSATFNIETGAGICGPCGDGVRRYDTRVTDGDLEIDVG